ncbi:hypothetical protein HYZ70_03575 [Candidatus Curtissbacteria bacterium]|nr:hypothetical protein [Candidatus Curtissbacteria bacterium]
MRNVILNFLAVVLLIGLVATPIYFAQNAASVAGVKSESKYLVVSQVEKFPGMTLSQQGDQYTVSFTKLGPSQAYLGVLIVNNPTNQTQNYSLQRLNLTGNLTGGLTSPTVFFGENLDDQKTQIAVPSGASVSASLFSNSGAEVEKQSVEFSIITD